MIKVKSNYKNGHQNLACRMCNEEPETQTHILEDCPAIHSDESSKVPRHQLFNENTDTLRKMAKNLEQILEKLSEVVC